MPTRVYSLGQSLRLQKAPIYAPKNALEVLKAIYFLMFRFYEVLQMQIKMYENKDANYYKNSNKKLGIISAKDKS